MITWNVYYYNINQNKVETKNIFSHSGFQRDLEKIRKIEDKQEFAEQLRRSLMYWYWSKAEWEVVVMPWGSSTDIGSIQIDVYDQVKMNWEHFVNYIWENR